MEESILIAGFCPRQFFLLIAQVMHYMGKNCAEKKSALGMFFLVCTVEKDVSYLWDFRLVADPSKQRHVLLPSATLRIYLARNGNPA